MAQHCAFLCQTVSVCLSICHCQSISLSRCLSFCIIQFPSVFFMQSVSVILSLLVCLTQYIFLNMSLSVCFCHSVPVSLSLVPYPYSVPSEHCPVPPVCPRFLLLGLLLPLLCFDYYGLFSMFLKLSMKKIVTWLQRISAITEKNSRTLISAKLKVHCMYFMEILWENDHFFKILGRFGPFLAISRYLEYEMFFPCIILSSMTFSHQLSCFNIHNIQKIPFFAQIFTKWGPFWVLRFL